MLTGIKVQSFKRFESQEFELAPLTVLAGLNGSGKTTLIQALLLAQEASVNCNQALRLNGPFGMELGTAEDVLNWNSNGPISIELLAGDDTSSLLRFTVPAGDSMYLNVDQTPSPPLTAFSGAPNAFSFLSAERFGPKIFAETSPLPQAELEVGHHGEFCAHVLSVLGSSLIQISNRSHPSFSDGKPRLLKYEVEQWLSEIARPVEINGVRLAGSTVAELRYRTSGSTWVRATNMGFGVTYALPIVLAGLITVQDGILIVENPEAHLHPAGQSKIGVFLAWLASRGVQCIIETHSDHVLNGIRRSIAEFKYLTSDSVVIHYFGESEGEGDKFAEVSTLRIGANGNVSDWPNGFFDQYQLDVAALGKIRRARR